MDRREKLLNGLDLLQLVGAEIGPLTHPIVSKDDGPVIYIDHADTEALKQKYYNDPAVDTDAIVDVDVLWGDNTIGEELGPGNSVDYVIASHVVEHVPDLVGWLKEISSVLGQGGSLRLAVPDRRFCFDYRRDDTRLSDILAAYFSGARSPQAREIIDFAIYHSRLDLGAAWDGSLATASPPGPDQLEHAFAAARRSVGGEYVDVHCWTFTLASFASIMQQLVHLGLTELACVRAFDTEVYEHEFFVIMTPASQAEAAQSWERVYSEAKGTTSLEVATWPEARRRWLREGNRPEVEQYKAEIAHLWRQVAADQKQIAEIHSSTSWRITGPLRAAVQRVRNLVQPG